VQLFDNCYVVGRDAELRRPRDPEPRPNCAKYCLRIADLDDACERELPSGQTVEESFA